MVLAESRCEGRSLEATDFAGYASVGNNRQSRERTCCLDGFDDLGRVKLRLSKHWTSP
jgi:hypothetical protein